MCSTMVGYLYLSGFTLAGTTFPERFRLSKLTLEYRVIGTYRQPDFQRTRHHPHLAPIPKTDRPCLAQGCTDVENQRSAPWLSIRQAQEQTDRLVFYQDEVDIDLNTKINTDRLKWSDNMKGYLESYSIEY